MGFIGRGEGIATIAVAAIRPGRTAETAPDRRTETG
jgi:hypothetical protein